MLLFTPGPTPVPEDVRQAMSQPTLHHRTPEFEAIFANVREKLIKLYNMPEALMLASSGTGAMEAAITNLCAKKALTINAGKFGERFGDICRAHNISLTELTYKWNTPANVDEIMRTLKNNSDIDAIFIQVCESAGGLRHPVEKIAEAIKAFNPDIMVVADGITALGVEKIDTTHLDCIIAGSQKAFMIPPGLAMLGLSEKAVAKIEERNIGYYFNLKTELKNQRKNTTAWTAATTLIIGLGAVLDKMFEMGLDTLYDETARRSLATQEALKAIGCDIYPAAPAKAMTTVIHEQAEAIRKTLKTEYKVNVAGGQNDLKGKIFRINHMGFIDLHESCWVPNAVELSMDKLGIRSFDGTANKIYLETYGK